MPLPSGFVNSLGDMDNLRAAKAGLAKRPSSLFAMDAYISALDVAGETDRALMLAVDAAGRRIRYLADLRPDREAKVLRRSSRIFLSGFFYSGSGAVYEFLEDVQGTQGWSPAGEPRLIKFPGGLSDLADSTRSHGALTDQELLDLYLHIAGAKASADPAGHYSKWGKVNRHSAKLLREPLAYGYVLRNLQCFLALVRMTRTETLSQDAVEELFRTYTSAGFNAAATDTGADVLLIDQAINAWRLPLARLVKPSTFIVVHRDPRDQFVDAGIAWSAPGRKRISAEAYVKQYQRHRKRAEIDKRTIEETMGHRVISLAFEDFVMDHDRVAPQLLRDLGLDARPRGSSYEVEKSRLNVGKYQAVLSPDEIATLEAGLPEYLSPWLTPPAKAPAARRKAGS